MRYTLPSGLWSEAEISLTIVKPTSTSCTAAEGHYTGYFWWRNYYHRVFDQSGNAIDWTGMSCSEEVTLIEGTAGWQHTSPGNSAYYPAESPFGGGIAIQDTIGAGYRWGYSRYRQVLTVMGWTTTPVYTIVINTDEPLDPLNKY